RQVHILNPESRPRFDQTGGELVWNGIRASDPSRLNIEFLQDLNGECAQIVVQQRNRPFALEGLRRVPADGIEEDICVEKLKHQLDRRWTSSRESRGDALKSPIRLLISRSCRFNRSDSVSGAASCSKKALTSAETDVSRSAAAMRARL